MIFIDYKNLQPDLKIFCDSVESIEEKYYFEKQTLLDNDEIVDTGKIRTNESTFVSELRDNYKRKLESTNQITNMFLQTDAPKQIIFRDEKTIRKYDRTFNVLFPKSKHEEFYRVPDIVFHGGPEDFIKQELISEVKICEDITNDLFDIDLFKLSVYHDELNFKYSIFVIANQSAETVLNLIKEYLKNRYYISKRDGLYILVKESFSEPSVLINPLEIMKAGSLI